MKSPHLLALYHMSNKWGADHFDGPFILLIPQRVYGIHLCRLVGGIVAKEYSYGHRIIQRYHSLRKGLLSEESLYRYIDETLDFIAPALERNDARWGSVEQQAKGLLVPVSRNLDSRSAAEGQLKGYLRNRGEWLDENIETLRQYSAPSRVKQYNEVND